jgi:hypothetical protein
VSASIERRLTALEQRAEAARVRNLREWAEDMARQVNMSPERTERYIARLLDLDRRIQEWLAAGVPRDEIVRRCAVDIGVPPEQFAQQLEEAARAGS